MSYSRGRFIDVAMTPKNTWLSRRMTTPCRFARYRPYRFDYRHVPVPRWLDRIRYDLTGDSNE